MTELSLRITYIGGPTALLEVGGLRLLTDPTFDPAGSEYRTPVYTLRKTQGPAVEPDGIGPLDVVLLSHEHHFDNLDQAGRALLGRAGRVLTVPLHYEGWEHFSESRTDIASAFAAAGMAERLRWPQAGQPTELGDSHA
ncbi:MAG TPA: MBL fold metallo-hydrolase [Gemmatimonadaceae bacterium]|nr:MBL fold metallo-hydrolase [Gemmatimonadaceae bacterium]